MVKTSVSLASRSRLESPEVSLGITVPIGSNVNITLSRSFVLECGHKIPLPDY